MNDTQSVILGIAAALSLSLGAYSADAQVFPASVNEVRISTNHNGNLVYTGVRSSDVIRACAAEKGITNLTGLVLVYNRTADSLQVVRETNLTTAVCTPLAFSGGTWLVNSNRTRAERLAFVSVEGSTTVHGTLAATERFAYGPTNQLVFYSLSGQLQYTVPASGTNPPAIYRGSLSASNRPVARGHEDEEEQGDNDDHGQGQGQDHGRGHDGSSPGRGHGHD